MVARKGDHLSCASYFEGDSIPYRLKINNSPVSAISLQPGESVTCTFVNTKRGSARVIKTVGNGGPVTGADAFVFQLRESASFTQVGTTLETVTATANNSTLNFTTALVPGRTYQLCEVVMPGWMTTLGPPFFSVFNPSGDNSTVCTDFQVVAGETKEFAIDNLLPPGGLARTIGFWKNWSSCTGANQKPKLDETLLAAAQSGFPIEVGSLVLNPRVQSPTTVCRNGVSILDKSDIKTGKKDGE